MLMIKSQTLNDSLEMSSIFFLNKPYIVYILSMLLENSLKLKVTLGIAFGKNRRVVAALKLGFLHFCALVTREENNKK